MASWLAGSDPFQTNQSDAVARQPRSLETFLAHLVRHHSGGIDFDVNDVLTVGRMAPLFVVLDGLDEVADIKQRSDVVTAVTKGVSRLRENSENLRVLITSRPAAFANSPGFDEEEFPHLQLGQPPPIGALAMLY